MPIRKLDTTNTHTARLLSNATDDLFDFIREFVGIDIPAIRREYWRIKNREPIPWRPPRGRPVAPSGVPLPHWEGPLLSLALDLLGLPVAVFADLLDRKIRQFNRPFYYSKENERRHQFRAANRRIRRRTTTSPQPSPDALRDAFTHAKDSAEAMIRFGSMIDDLECYVNNSLIFNQDGRIVGRHGGIRAYLAQELPDLYPKYKTIMRYRVIARNFRRACKTSDPTPAAALLPATSPAPSPSTPAPHEKIPPTYSQSRLLKEARQVAKEILGCYKGTIISLTTAIEAELHRREDEFAANFHRKDKSAAGEPLSSGGTPAKTNHKKLFAVRQQMTNTSVAAQQPTVKGWTA